MTHKAILTNKRKQVNSNGFYVVSVTCSECQHTDLLSFSGWSGIGCLGCGAELERTPYRRSKTK